MKKYLLFTFILISSHSFGQSWNWGKQGTTQSDDEYETCVAADSNGDGYLSGFFKDSISFGSHHLTSKNWDAFLVKYDSSGNIVWINQSNSRIGGSGISSGCTVATDDSNNVYISGKFYDTVSFGSATLNSTYSGFFLVKYDPAGNLVWARQSVNNTLLGYSFSIATDDSANVFVTGTFTDSLIFGTIKFKSSNTNFFLVKYASNGRLLWVKVSSGGSNAGLTTGTTASCDLFGNVYVTGYFTDSISLGALYLKSTVNPCCYHDMFLIKYNHNGNVIWAKQSNAKSPIATAYAWSVINDNIGNSYVTGSFTDTVKFGSILLYSKSYPVMTTFLAKYDINGNVIWVKQSSQGWSGYCLERDKYNYLYLSLGAYPGGYITFCNDTLSINGSTDASVFMKLDTAGDALHSSMIVTGGDDKNCIACSPSGKYIYVSGDIFDTITFGPDHLNNFGTEPPFIARWAAKYSQSDEGINKILTSSSSISLFPNPNNGVFNIGISAKEQGVSKIEVYNMLGEKVYSNSYQPLANSQQLITIDLNSQPNGVYLYRVMDETGALLGSGKFIIQR